MDFYTMVFFNKSFQTKKKGKVKDLNTTLEELSDTDM